MIYDLSVFIVLSKMFSKLVKSLKEKVTKKEELKRLERLELEKILRR